MEFAIVSVLVCAVIFKLIESYNQYKLKKISVKQLFPESVSDIYGKKLKVAVIEFTVSDKGELDIVSYDVFDSFTDAYINTVIENDPDKHYAISYVYNQNFDQ